MHAVASLHVHPDADSSQPSSQYVALLQPVQLDTRLPTGTVLLNPAVYTVSCGTVIRSVTLTGDMDDDLDVLEALEDELGVSISMNGLPLDESHMSTTDVPSAVHGHGTFCGDSSLCVLPRQGLQLPSNRLQNPVNCPGPRDRWQHVDLSSNGNAWCLQERRRAAQESRTMQSQVTISHATTMTSSEPSNPGRDYVEPRCQIHGHGPVCCISSSVAESAASDVCSIQSSQEFVFETEAESRLLYHDEKVHCAIILLLLSLLITPDGQVDHLYTAQEPLAGGAGQKYADMDLCMVLYYHLNHSRNRSLLSELLQGAHALGGGTCRLLKLLVHALFPMHAFGGERKHLAHGTFSYVQRHQILFCGESSQYVAEKVHNPTC